MGGWTPFFILSRKVLLQKGNLFGAGYLGKRVNDFKRVLGMGTVASVYKIRS